MAVSLPFELNKFCKQARQLRQILRDTKRTFADINAAGNFNGAQVVSAEFGEDEEKEVSLAICKTPCLVILGQNTYAKSFIVNELFNRAILPHVSKDDESLRWRTVKFHYGEKASICLTLPGSYELVDNLVECDKSWRPIPMEDLLLDDDEDEDEFAHNSAVLEVNINHPLLREGCNVVMSSSRQCAADEDELPWCSDNILPVVIYGIAGESLTDKDLKDLAELRTCHQGAFMFFVKVPPPSLNSPSQKVVVNGRTRRTDRHKHRNKPRASSSPHARFNGFVDIDGSSSEENSFPSYHHGNRNGNYGNNSGSQQDIGSNDSKACPNLWKQLTDLDYLSASSSSNSSDNMDSSSGNGNMDLYQMESVFIDDFANFSSIVPFVKNSLQNILIHAGSILNVVHTRCLQTFIITAFDMARDILITPKRLEFAKSRESELYQSLMDIATKKQAEIKTLISDTISCMTENVLTLAEQHEFVDVEVSENGEITSVKDVRICAEQIRELVLGNLNAAIGANLLSSVNILRDSYTGTLTRCLESLEQSDKYSQESLATTEAFRQILNAAYQVDITVRTSLSFIRFLLEKMKQIAQSMPWKTPPLINKEWKRKVAADMIKSLSEARLAKSVCSQVKDRLRNSHDTFSSALKQLEVRHTVRLDRTEEQRLKVRKIYAPKVARLALESTSFKDQIMYGMPNMGREVGRGQYGVVYSCENWAGFRPVAVKSVVPPDDKHWNDLSMEFYYTKNVQEHERIVQLRGSVIDYTYGGGNSPAVLLIMDRLKWDLYAAIKSGMDWIHRLQVAIDVVEGIRFLHSQGLVHRDIKLKNVLLDGKNRGKLTDLGFCKPEAMMSGSIVGTPIHMAPELFSGRYDNSVDVYAFGILFWYVCAGHVRLPYNFEQCTSKDMLWTSVKRGVRPEKLPTFDTECWELMQKCWDGDPNKRPLLGNVQTQLQAIKERCKKEVLSPPNKKSNSRTRNRKSPVSDI